jgi:hypothetical protein
MTLPGARLNRALPANFRRTGLSPGTDDPAVIRAFGPLELVGGNELSPYGLVSHLATYIPPA